MSGPVWVHRTGERDVCEACGREVEASFVVGTIVEARHVPHLAYCEPCYRALGPLADSIQVPEPVAPSASS